MRNLSNMIFYKKASKNLLLKYGFKENNNEYKYEKNIMDDSFKVIVIYYDNLFSKVIDNSTNDEYLLVDAKDATGNFVGKIKNIYDDIIKDIVDKCFVNDIYKTKQSKKVIEYIKSKYDSDLEYLWDDCNAIARNKSNDKWFILFMVISKNKLGDYDSNKVEVVNLKYPTDRIDKLVDNKKIFKGYHMNKKHWITIVLDNKLNDDELLRLIDISYILSND